jgi:TIR domain
MVNIFICYSHKDKDYLDELKQYFRDNPAINLWSDIHLQPGDEWDNEIRQNLEVADIVILLISIDRA